MKLYDTYEDANLISFLAILFPMPSLCKKTAIDTVSASTCMVCLVESHLFNVSFIVEVLELDKKKTYLNMSPVNIAMTSFTFMYCIFESSLRTFFNMDLNVT